jgi:hypothetical protein
MKAFRNNRGVTAILMAAAIVVFLTLGYGALTITQGARINKNQIDKASDVLNRTDYLSLEFFSGLLKSNVIVPFIAGADNPGGAGTIWLNLNEVAGVTTVFPPPSLFQYSFTPADSTNSFCAGNNCCSGVNCHVNFAYRLCLTTQSFPINFQNTFLHDTLPDATACPTSLPITVAIRSLDPTNKLVMVRANVEGEVLRTLANNSIVQGKQLDAKINATPFPGQTNLPAAPTPQCSLSAAASEVASGDCTNVTATLSLLNPPPFTAATTLPGPNPGANFNGWISNFVWWDSTSMANPPSVLTKSLCPANNSTTFQRTATTQGFGQANSSGSQCSTSVYVTPVCSVVINPASANLSGGTACTSETIRVSIPDHPNADQVTVATFHDGATTAVPATANTDTAARSICFNAAGTYTINGSVNHSMPGNTACAAQTFTVTDPPPSVSFTVQYTSPDGSQVITRSADDANNNFNASSDSNIRLMLSAQNVTGCSISSSSNIVSGGVWDGWALDIVYPNPDSYWNDGHANNGENYSVTCTSASYPSVTKNFTVHRFCWAAGGLSNQGAHFILPSNSGNSFGWNGSAWVGELGAAKCYDDIKEPGHADCAADARQGTVWCNKNKAIYWANPTMACPFPRSFGPKPPWPTDRPFCICKCDNTGDSATNPGQHWILPTGTIPSP